MDPGKDQSYVLAVLPPEQLSRAMFPLGDSTKDEVREEAAERGLAWPTSRTATTSASSRTGTRGFLAGRRATPRANRGHRRAPVGTHDGAFGFTIGQRKGLRIGAGRRRTATLRAGIEPVSRTTVGPRESLDVSEIRRAAGVDGLPAAREPRECMVQLRAHGEVHRATPAAVPAADHPGPARPGRRPGQAAVLYDGDTVLGSATISETRTGAPASWNPPADPAGLRPWPG